MLGDIYVLLDFSETETGEITIETFVSVVGYGHKFVHAQTL